MTWSGRPALFPGAYPLGSQLEAVLDQIDALTDSDFTTYTPTWTGTTTNPVLNNGTIGAEYWRAPGGMWVLYRGKITIGSTTTFGSGFWEISLPVSASTGSIAYMLGTAQFLDFGTIRRPGNCWSNSSATKIQFVSDSGDVTPTVPMTWATNDILWWNVLYEAA